MTRPAIARAIQNTVRDVANEVVRAEVAEQLDPSVVEELQLQAATAARRSVAAALDELDEQPVDEEPQLYFGSVDEFVRGYLLPNYRRRVDGQRVLWAADWWKYAQAVARLDALWRAWEHLRQDAQTAYRCGSAITPTTTCRSCSARMAPSPRLARGRSERTRTKRANSCPTSRHPRACSLTCEKPPRDLYIV